MTKMWYDTFKDAGVSIHVIAAGAGARIAQQLWEVPGSSAYLSGFSFPYAQEEQTELLGFTPEHYCSEEAAIDLASAAYMKAYRFGGKKPIGVGLTATVASDKEHRGDNRVYCCTMTDDKVYLEYKLLKKGIGQEQRAFDGDTCDSMAHYALNYLLGNSYFSQLTHGKDATQLATERFFLRTFFHANGARDNGDINDHQGLMAGAFNPPHEGHFGMAQSFKNQTGCDTVFEISTDPPHKAHPTVQDLLKRAKMLQGHERIFTKGMAMYIDKSKRYPNRSLIMGADAALRLFDSKWKIDSTETMLAFANNFNKIYVADRMVDGKLVGDIELSKLANQLDIAWNPFYHLDGQWNVSSTELRNKAHQ